MSKNLRIAIAQIWQEQNTFSPIKTEIEDFEQYGLYYGSEIVDRFSDANELGGFITILKKQKNIEIIPIIRAWAWPKGNVSGDAYNKLKREMLNILRDSLPLDGILISFHGAMVSDIVLDIEGDILDAIHEFLDREVPIVISCDMHANITKKMLDNTLFIEGYHTCPHVDLFRAGMKAASVFLDVLNGKKNIKKYFIKLPMITPVRSHDSRRGIFKEIFDLVTDIEKRPGILSSSVFTVQPWLDVPELGWSVLVYSDSNSVIADKYANEIAKFIWDRKKEFFINEMSPSEVLDEASNFKKGFMVVSDSDATTAGAPGDNTVILSEILSRNIDFPVLMPFIDREVVCMAINAGKGSIIETTIGGKMDNIFCKPVNINAKITRVGQSIFKIVGHLGKNTFNMGKSAILEVGMITILVCEKNGPFYEPTVYRNSGLEPSDFRMVVVKSPVGFRDSYEKIADRIILAVHPGLSSSDLRIFNFKNIPRPIYPFNQIENIY